MFGVSTPSIPGHKRSIRDNGEGEYTVRCAYCGLIGEGYLTRDYAIDGWREAHGLDPITNYPQV